MGKSLAVEVGPKQGRGLGGGRDQCSGPTRLEKALGAVGNRTGLGMPPTPGLRGQGTSPGSTAGSPGPSGQVKRPPLLSLPAWLLQPASPDLPSLPPMPPGPTWPGWGLEGGGTGSAGSRGLSGRGNRPPLLSRLPLLIS